MADLGPQPLTGCFPETPGAVSFRYRLVLEACTVCGLVQLSDPPPRQALARREPWVSYREPETHLEEIADRLSALEGLGAGTTAVGLGEHDQPVLEQLELRGLRPRSIDWRAELGVDREHAGVETLQELLSPEAAAGLVSRHGRADLVVARSLVEHAHDVRRLVAALDALVAPGGYVFVEVPDSEPALEGIDPSVLWEEHTLYFTEATLRAALERLGLSVVWSARPARATQLDVVARRVDRRGAPPGTGSGPQAELERARRFATGLPDRRARWVGLLDEQRREGRSVALFGAGHVGAMFANVFDLGPLLSCAIDDHPAKQGRLIPGAEIPIRRSAALVEDDIEICLMALSPESEERVVEGNRSWLSRGGEFWSIFPGSPRYALAA